MPDIESLLKEKRSFKTLCRFQPTGELEQTNHERIPKARREESHKVLGQDGQGKRRLVQAMDEGPGLEATFCKVVSSARRPMSRTTASTDISKGLTPGARNKAAIIWEGEPGDTRIITYAELHKEVCRFANVLKSQGIKKGDRVCLYMPMIPELAIAMLACTRIGAPHSIVFGGFSADALSDRINDAEAKPRRHRRRGLPKGCCLRSQRDGRCRGPRSRPALRPVVVVARTNQDVEMKSGRDLWWHELMADASTNCAPAKLDAEHPLFILYTSGTTGNPKGILHTTGGYLTHVTTTFKAIFDIKDDDVYWCTADIGWITGHSYVVYGPLANGATTVMYEGTPTEPGPDRWWSLIEKWGVSIFYTAPTAIRTFIRLGDEHPKSHDLTSLRLLGSVGEPINPEAWMWYHRVIGGKRCPIVDTWWQTETGGIMISPLPGAVDTKPGSATKTISRHSRQHL